MEDSLSQAVETALSPKTEPAPEVRQSSRGSRSARPAETEVARQKHVDHHLWGTYLLLVFIAIVELFSASIQDVHDNDIFGPILRHGGFLIAGFGLMLLLQHVHYRYVYGAIPFFVIGAICLQIAVAIGGESINGAVRSIRIAGINILPAEFMKLAAALGTAWILSQTQMSGKRDVTWAGLVCCLAFMYLCCGLLFSQGLSNTILVVAISFSMMLIAGMGLKKFFIALGVTLVLGGSAFYIKTHRVSENNLSDYQKEVIALNHEELEGVASGRGQVWVDRIKNHFRDDKFNDKIKSENQQEMYSYIAQAHGGLLGVGPGKSRENARLPLASLDYIFAIIIEELGLFAGLFILTVYMWILGRSAKLTVEFKHSMPGIMVMGCAFVIVFQALFHMSIVSGVLPVSGQPLPLISKGGISVLATSLAFGVMLSCAKHATRVSDTRAEQAKENEILPENARTVNPATISVNKN